MACVLGRYTVANYPTGDDFWAVWSVNKYGVWGHVKYLYQTINGRVGSNLLMGVIVKMGWLNFAVKVMPLFLFMTTFYLINASLKKAKVLTQFQAVQLSLWGAVGILFFLPGVYESIFWLSSAINYLFPTLFFASLAVFFSRKDAPVSMIKGCIFFTIVIFFSTFNELVSGMAFIAILLYNFIFAVYKRSVFNKNIILLLAGIALGLMILILSPGNWMKLSGINKVSQGLHSDDIWMGWAQACWHLLKSVVLNPFFWAFFYGVYLVVPYQNRTPKISFRSIYFLPILFWVFLPSTIFVLLEADVVPLRLSALTVLTGWFTGGFFLLWYFFPFLKTQNRFPIGLTLNSLVALLLIIQFGFSPSLKAGLCDVINKRIDRYQMETTARHASIINCYNDTCNIPALSYHPVWLDPYPIEEHPVNLANFAKALGKRQINIITP